MGRYLSFFFYLSRGSSFMISPSAFVKLLAFFYFTCRVIRANKSLLHISQYLSRLQRLIVCRDMFGASFRYCFWLPSVHAMGSTSSIGHISGVRQVWRSGFSVSVFGTCSTSTNRIARRFHIGSLTESLILDTHIHFLKRTSYVSTR